ncbi:MAG: tetratricopeptide repeat protein [Caulobacteraceae bacterium]|nr:tetratricopeptide repeat protein [Caulobacteraceae bacterium]
MSGQPQHAPAFEESDLGAGDPAPAPQAARPRPADVDMGDSTSQEALERLNHAVTELKALSVAPLLHRAITAIRQDDAKTAASLAIQVLEQDERNGLAWHVLAIARELAGDFRNSIQAYEAALALLPDHAEVANDLGRLAFRMGQKPLAAQLFMQYRQARPDCPHGANNLACVLRDLHQYPAAVEVLQRAITANLGDAALWNTLGTVVSAQGDAANALIFFEEALRLQPDFAKARYNRGNTRLEFGQFEGALADCEAAMTGASGPAELAMMRLAQSTMLLCAGRVGEGWDAYEARLDPMFAEVTHFMSERPRWTPETELDGRSLLLFGEQGLGDEVMFANYLPDLIEALGPDGRLTLALEPRLIPLFQRSFPKATIGPHATYKLDGHTMRAAHFVTDDSGVELWAPLASPLRRFRRSIADFPERGAYLKPDTTRVEHWRRELAALSGRKVGILWKSLKLDGARLREFSPFEQWRPVLETPGVSFVNLQYGECAAELAEAREAMGLDIWNPPGIDLKNDLDDVAALTCALDLIIAPANATSNIGAACGAPVWFISTPIGWPRLGAARYPWYPHARVFIPERFGQWDGVMREAAEALGRWLG